MSLVALLDVDFRRFRQRGIVEGGHSQEVERRLHRWLEVIGDLELLAIDVGGEELDSLGPEFERFRRRPQEDIDGEGVGVAVGHVEIDPIDRNVRFGRFDGQKVIVVLASLELRRRQGQAFLALIGVHGPEVVEGQAAV